MASRKPLGFTLRTIRQGMTEHRYVLYAPADYDDRKRWPTILFLHGAGECGRDGVKQIGVGIGPAIMQNSDRWPFLVLIPQKPERRETWAQHDELLLRMLDAVKKDYHVDEDRTYLTGLSQGGFGTWAIGAKTPDRWAAIAPICGGGDKSTAAALKEMPIRAFHGETDPTVPLARSQEMVQAVRDAGGTDVELTVYPGVGHNSWDKAYGEAGIPDWFLKNTRRRGKG